MIFTVTFNPSIDYIASVPDFKLGRINRTLKSRIFPGGKGINVSLVLNHLGIPNVALGFIAGFTGNEIEQCLRDQDCLSDFIHLNQGNSRINVKIKADEETELNGNGPLITAQDLENLFRKIAQIRDGDILVLSGSIPESLSLDTYEQIMRQCGSKKIRIIVDASGPLLLNTLKNHPYLIKPNNYELEEAVGRKLTSRQAILNAASELQKRGARNILVSLGKHGAILLDESGKIYECAAPSGNLINSTGAGDSMIAGFLKGQSESDDPAHALRMAVAAGSASAFSMTLATRDEVQTQFDRIEK